MTTKAQQRASLLVDLRRRRDRRDEAFRQVIAHCDTLEAAQAAGKNDEWRREFERLDQTDRLRISEVLGVLDAFLKVAD